MSKEAGRAASLHLPHVQVFGKYRSSATPGQEACVLLERFLLCGRKGDKVHVVMAAGRSSFCYPPPPPPPVPGGK